MNKLITEQQVNEVIKVLQEVPAKFSYGAIAILLSLPTHEDLLPPKDSYKCL